ncbi:MAG: hypothetical protein KGL35_30370, partial [Bradyrhizobium sp.]|nr:hypothetical protein [Bradyrhizobium sp.]
ERDKETALTTAVSDLTGLTLQVADGAQIDRGVVEIDDELMEVQSVDKIAGIVTLQPWGRGARATTAATHTVGSRVVSNPTFPRTRIKATINQIINDIYPQLFSVAVDATNTVNPAQVTYPVNANADSILSIRVQTIGPSQMWAPITRFQFDRLAATSFFASGRSVDIFQSMPPGRPIKIVYRQRFGQFVNETDTFASVNLDEGYRDILALGAEARLLPALDNPRMQLNSSESRAQAQFDQPGIASQVARQLLQTFQQRVRDEQDRLLRMYPSSMVRMS